MFDGYLVFVKALSLLWQKCYAIEQVFVVVDYHILSNNLPPDHTAILLLCQIIKV